MGRNDLPSLTESSSQGFSEQEVGNPNSIASYVPVVKRVSRIIARKGLVHLDLLMERMQVIVAAARA